MWNKGKSTKFVPLDSKTNTPSFFTAPGTFHYRASEATFLAYDAAASIHAQHVKYDTLLRNSGRLPHHAELFFAYEDLHLQDKENCEEDEVSEDDDTVQISNISHLDVASSDACPIIHPTGNHKWGECQQNHDNESIQRGSLTFSPLPHQSNADRINDAMLSTNDQAELL